MGKIRGTHSSPGIYTQFTDLSYAASSLGITTLGLVGETKKGPAFEPIMVSSWTQFSEYFGTTSAELFKNGKQGSKYPKYELPYIAKSYLSASDQLYVCRVLGLSGYNAGPAFVITAKNSKENNAKSYVVAVLRSRGHYNKYSNVGTDCNPISAYDTLVYDCDTVEISPATDLKISPYCESGTTVVSGSTSASTLAINALNMGQFKLTAKKNGEVVDTYTVSFNAGSSNYIYKVLGSEALRGDDNGSALYVEELYDIYLKELIDSGAVDMISDSIETIKEVKINAICDPVTDVVKIGLNNLKRMYLGQTYICAEAGTTGETGNDYVYYNGASGVTTIDSTTYLSGLTTMEVGHIYKVKSLIVDNVRKYVYVPVYDGITGRGISVGKIIENSGTSVNTVNSVKVMSYNTFVCLNESDSLVTLNTFNNYREEYRCATTPWIVSEIKGDVNNLEIKKLFRFHTISDGKDANEQVKISIANVRPDEGTFDVYVRDYNDSDGNPVILESYKNLTMVPGTKKYIGLAIGTLNGDYEIKSKYVMVEVVENDMTANCVPAGFLGYPTRKYDETKYIAPKLTYNLYYDSNIKAKKQYFGVSDLVGVDVDMLTYKGKDAYTEDYENGYTNPFHLDCTLSKDILKEMSGVTVTLDGEELKLEWDTVSKSNLGSESLVPVISTEEDMVGTIYEDVNLRKFTVYPYGGFDGWDVYRSSRTTGDDFKANKYKGVISNGNGQTFSKISNGEALNLTGNCITSDYYAFLAGAMQFDNPEKYLINLFATPGIDYVNQNDLSSEILDMIEEKRGDSLYVMTTPDKPSGADDDISDIYTSSDVASNLEDAEIDSYYAATYYPWVKYYDSENSRYIHLPATKDVLRNMADVDNKKYPWFAPAGIERGDVDCVKMRYFAKLEDEDNVYDGRINPLKTFSKDGVKIWGNKTMYTGDTPMNRINVVRLMLYMRKLITEACRTLIFEPNDTTLKDEFKSIVNPILAQIKSDRGITDYRLDVSQTAEQMDAHELSAKVWVKPTPTLEYIELNFMVTPQSVDFDEV